MILLFDIVLQNKHNFSDFYVLANSNFLTKARQSAVVINLQLAHLLRRLRVPRLLHLAAVLSVRVLDPPVDGEAKHPRVSQSGAVEVSEPRPVLGELGPWRDGQDQGVHPHTVSRSLEMWKC